MPPSPLDQVIQLLLNQVINLPGALQRHSQALLVRLNTAVIQWLKFSFEHPRNNDEQLYANRNYIGNYTKALPHDSILGEVVSTAYLTYRNALQVGTLAAVDGIPLGGMVTLTDPLAAYAFELEGADSHGLTMPAAPAFSSAQEISEISEVYWQALTRDVPFSKYDTDLDTKAAANDLSGFSDFRGPINGQVTTTTLFRGDLPGDLIGPYLSQFLWLDVPYGIAGEFPGGTPVPCIEQRNQFPQLNVNGDGTDFITTRQDWLDIQNGKPPAPANPTVLDNNLRYIHTSRDLAEFVHRDYPYLTFVNACLILLSYGRNVLDPANPYLTPNTTQTGFVTFGASDILDLVARVANEALKAAWYQKWLVHRRLRPEEFGGWLDNQLNGLTTYPFNSEIVRLNQPNGVLPKILAKYNSYLLPQAYPEGCPTHPAYPSGHATYAGACVTVLKAFFKEEFVIPQTAPDVPQPPKFPLVARVANDDGTDLLNYQGSDLTVGGELNKLASNIAIGRDAAGVHWRTDASEGLRLGEQVAICLLQDRVQTYREDFPGYTLTKFNNQRIRINKDGTITNL